MAGRPRKVNTEETGSPETAEASTSEYTVTVTPERKKASEYAYQNADYIQYYAVLKYGDEVIADARFDDDEDMEWVRSGIKRWAERQKRINEVKLGNVEPETFKLED